MSNPKGDSLQMTLLFILPSQQLPNHKFFRKILTTLNAGDMEFNPSKCQVIHITRSKIPIPTQYTLHNCILESVSVYANVRRIAEIRKWSDMIEKKSVFVCHNVR